MNYLLDKKSICFNFIFFIIMSGYALLRELRDAVFIHLVGLSFLPKAKLFSLCFLFFELLFYQKLIDLLQPKDTFCCFAIFYSIFLFVFAGLFYYDPFYIPSCFGYFFYIMLEGYVPFIWSLLWAIFTQDNNHLTVKNKYMLVSFFAQVGGFFFSFLFYYLIKKKIFFTINVLFSSIMFTSAVLLLLSSLLMYGIKKNNNIVVFKEKNIQKNDYYSVFFTWYNSLKKIFESFYVIGIFLIIFCWEMVNITLNYFRLDLLLEKTNNQGIYLLEDLYYSISLTYFIGVFVVLFGASFLVRLYGVKKTLIMFPVLLWLSVVPLFVFGKGRFLVMIYMVIKALYPALIFPLKESLYLVTTEEIRYKSKSWIDGLGSRFSKTGAAFYIQITLLFSPENRYLLHIVFFSMLFLIFLLISNYVGKVWEKNIQNNKIIG